MIVPLPLHVVPVWCLNCLRRHFVFVFIFPCYVVLSFAYQVILILCIFLFCSFCILLFAHSRQRKLNLFHWGTVFSISFVHLSLKNNKKLNLFHPILNIGQGKGQFCQKNLKTRSIPTNFNNKAGQRPILSKESKNSIYSIPFQK